MYILKPDEELAKVFSDTTRLRIIQLLSDREMTNSQLAKLLKLSKPTISHHMKLLLATGVVKISKVKHERHGIQMKYYTLNPNMISTIACNEDKLKQQIKNEIQKALKEKHDDANIAFLRLLKLSILSTGIEMDKPFYDAGYYIGSNVISKQITSSALKGVLEELAELWKKLKLGRMKFSQNRIIVKDCYQCKHMPDMGKPLCPSDAGIIAGVLDKTLGGGHVVKETKCWGTGYDFCEFEIDYKTSSMLPLLNPIRSRVI